MNVIVIILVILLLILLFKKLYFTSSFSNIDLKTKLLKNNTATEQSIKSIPKKLFQTYYNKSKIPDYIKSNITKYANGYSYTLFDDIEGLNFITEYFNEPVIKRFNTLSGAHKADLLRYCYLYIHGGVYADIKTIFIKNLDQIFDHSKKSIKNIFYSVLSIVNDSIYQGIMATNMYNPLFLVLINKILKSTNKQLKNDYHLFTKQMYILVESIKNNEDIILFKELCVREGVLDQYGHYCKILNQTTGEHLFDTRDPKYPW
jgi:hypothetical protein